MSAFELHLGGELERSFDLFGSRVRVLIGAPGGPSIPEPELAALAAGASLRSMHRSLTRFDPGSELSRLNAATDRTVATSPLVLDFLEAARWAWRHTDGLVDAAVLESLERCGYAESRVDRSPAPLAAAIAAAPPRRAARRRSAAPWPQISIDAAAGTVTRPPGVRFDSGGIAKGLAADLCAERLVGYSSFAVDCGGDLRIGGGAGLERQIEVTDPYSGEACAVFGLARGAVATSGLRSRVWRHEDGFAHHLIDPGRGLPSWTGLVQASAVAPTAVEAEALAKAALLSGPSSAAGWLSRWGGIVFDDAGRSNVFGPLASRLSRTAVAA
jgi:thiamine biosynthesis lipoprotein